MAELAAYLSDLDGTLIDTAEANFLAYAAAFAEAGVTLDRAGFDRAAHGRHWRDFVPALLAVGRGDPANIAQRKRALYPDFMHRTRVNAPLLALLRAARLARPVGLVTTASRPSVSALLAAHGIEDLFDVVITGDDVGEPKPSPAPYLAAAAALGVPPEQCLAFEDSEIGLASASGAGMKVLCVKLA